MKFEHWLAWRYLASPNKPKSLSLLSWVSVIGITLGVAALVVVICVMSGFQMALEKAIWQMTGHIVVMESGRGFPNLQRVENALETIKPDIKQVVPVVYGEGMLVAEGGIRGVVAEGIDLSAKAPPLPILEGKKFSGTHEIIIGSILAEELRVKKGDQVKIVIPLSEVDGGSRVETFTVVDLFESGMHGFDSKYTFIPMKTSQDLFHLGDSFSALKIYLRDSKKTEKIRETLRNQLPYSVMVRDWRDFNYNLFTAISQQKLVISLLLIIIIIVAAFNVASSLFMLVMDKQVSISLMQAVGSTKSQVAHIFVSAGSVVGTVGTVLGIALGLLIVFILRYVPLFKLPQEIYHFRYLPVTVRGMEIVVIALVVMVVCFLSTLYPAIRASRLNPIEGIRYE